MKVSLNWLRDWVAFDLAPEALATQLTLAGLESAPLPRGDTTLAGVVVGHITAVAPHPQADRLQVCTVATGAGAPLSIVCGAANARAGIKVPCATVGTVLPGGIEIREANLRGVDSHGMLCSAEELGLADKADGLLELHLRVGVLFESAGDLGDEVVPALLQITEHGVTGYWSGDAARRENRRRSTSSSGAPIATSNPP